MRHWIAMTLLGGLFLVFSNCHRAAATGPTFSELSPEVSARLDQQRAVVAAAAKQRYGYPALSRTEKDLPILQHLIDEKAFARSQSYELQCLGVVFGDVLVSELQVRWVLITDEYGTDPTLRLQNTNLNINALTMISKRVERDDPVDVFQLLQQSRDALVQAEKNLH